MTNCAVLVPAESEGIFVENAMKTTLRDRDRQVRRPLTELPI